MRFLTSIRARAALTIDSVRGAVVAVGRAFASAVLWFLLMLLIGSCLIVAGVYVLAGLGWALIAGGVAALASAAFLRIGMTNG